MIIFDWDDRKAAANLKKHRVSFEEAATVFSSSPVRVFTDKDNLQDDEERMIAIGYSHIHRLLIVVHCYLENEEVIRIISARKTTKAERKFFEEE